MDYKQIIDLAIKATTARQTITSLYALKGANHLDQIATDAVDKKINDLTSDIVRIEKKIKKLVN